MNGVVAEGKNGYVYGVPKSDDAHSLALMRKDMKESAPDVARTRNIMASSSGIDGIVEVTAVDSKGYVMVQARCGFRF